MGKGRDKPKREKKKPKKEKKKGKQIWFRLVDKYIEVIYLLYGQPGSGMTTLGELLGGHLMTRHHIDGDHFRKIFNNSDYSAKGRSHNIRTANAVATYLAEAYHGAVIMSLVSPYYKLRQELAERVPTVQILLESNRDLRKEHHCNDFEVGKPDVIINTDSDEYDTFNLLLSKIGDYITAA